jgi:hypothetical protein
MRKDFDFPKAWPQLVNNIYLYDQFLQWYITLATLLFYSAEKKQQTEINTYGLMAGAVCSLMKSIRHEVVLGTM